jgi:ribose 5-phosphate isomerase A
MDPKQLAGVKAVNWIQSGMRLGLGTGSTVYFTLKELGARLASGQLRDIVGVPTSEATTALAQKFGIPLADLNDLQHLDLVIDGADEVDPSHNLIKGLGGALLREKIVATAATQRIIVVDASKQVSQLGTRSPLPVEVASFGWRVIARALAALGCEPTIRTNNNHHPVSSDGGNYLLDCRFPHGIEDPHTLAMVIQAIPGVLEHGLFLDFAPTVIVANSDGNVEVREPSP